MEPQDGHSKGRSLIWDSRGSSFGEQQPPGLFLLGGTQGAGHCEPQT